MNSLTQHQFDQAVSQGARVVPFCREVLLDTETPMSVFMKLCGDDRGYLLESVEGGDQVARYSFIGFEPILTVESSNGLSTVVDEDGEKTVVAENPLDTLRKLLKAYRVPRIANLPRFAGGLVGHLSYDLVRFIERLPHGPVCDIHVPDLALMACRKMVVFDHVTRCARIVLNIPVKGDRRPTYSEAMAEVEDIMDRIRRPLTATAQETVTAGATTGQEPSFSISRSEFMDAVRKAKQYIRLGEIFQVVLSQRAELPLTTHPLTIYRVLRTVNPSPYMFYINSGGFQLAGASPEMLVRLEDGVVDSKPIAGTRKRGSDPAGDAAMEKELLTDEKERAEHVMLVDLSRNDVGRVCRYGSVRVPKFVEVERFSHVMHIVSEVQGLVRDGVEAVDVLEACFPAGTLSGAPKVRAMEIIDELEPLRRGPYGGAVGYFGFSGNMDTCITIRTALIHRNKVYVQAGAGIVFDSDPEREHTECMDKARALFSALERAGEV